MLLRGLILIAIVAIVMPAWADTVRAMSRVLSRVRDRVMRIKLIDHFYAELDCDAHK